MAAVIGLASGIPCDAQRPAPAPGVQIISVQGYPEWRVDGHPFFVHAAEFSYYRIPKDLWSHSLDRFRELVINTIDLHIPCNWHELREGELDFDGHTNPRRDLRGLLQMISEKGFYLIARPGPASSDEWENDGYPDWLDTNNPNQTTRWLTAVAHELAPYNSTKIKTSPADNGNQSASQAESSGRLLFIFLDAAPAIDSTGSSGQTLLRSAASLRDGLAGGGIETHFATTEAHAENGLNPSSINSGIAVAGKWYMKQAGHASVTDPKAGGARVTDDDAQTLAFLAQNLRLQSDFPAFIAGFQAGWPTPADDSAPPRSSSSNTLLGTRWLMAQGVSGIEYSPLQDSLTPPGFQTASANRDFRWNAALDLNGEKQERALAVIRNGKFLETWGEFLASSHPRAGIGLIDWRSQLSTGDGIPPALVTETSRQANTMFRRVERVALLAGLPVELVSPGAQSTALLLHNSLLLLAIPDSLRGKTFIAPVAQTALIEYVRAGGVLICNPERPTGAAFDEALRGATSQPSGDGFRVTPLGRGRVVEWSKDFYSWLDPNESFKESFARQESHFAITVLQTAANLANLRAPVVQSNQNQATLLVNELVSNAAAEMLSGQKSDCALRPVCTKGLLNVTNWSGTEEIQQTLKFLPPDIDPRVATDSDFVELPVDIPARESLMLPLNYPLCSSGVSANNCPDRIVTAGAELLGTAREGKALELMLYAPTAATVILRLRSAPSSVDLPVMSSPGPRNAPPPPIRRPRSPVDTNEGLPLGPSGEPVPVLGDPSFPERTLHGTYEKTTGIFRVIVPRGAAPTFQRILRVHLNYDPDVPERQKPAKQHGRGYQFAVADAVRLPLNDGKSLASEPPIVLLDKDHNGQFLIESQNLDDSSVTIQATVSGAAQGSASLRMGDQESDIETMKVRGSGSTEPDHEGFLAGTLNLSGGHNPDRSSPIRFLVAESETPVHYEYDFERSGSKNFVLENKRTRLIFLPVAGGQISALVDKLTGTNLTTMVGGLRDLVSVSDFTGTTGATHLIDPMMNVPYEAEWSAVNNDTSIRMKARWPQGSPITGDITKTVRMSARDGTDVVEVEYLIHAANQSGEVSSTASERSESASVVTAFSVPAAAEKPDGTQICWLAGTAQSATDTAANTSAGAEKCSAFVALGNLVEIPAAAARIEMRTPGRPTLAMEWTAGRVTIEQKQYSARILLEFPAPASGSGAENANYVVRYIVVRAP